MSQESVGIEHREFVVVGAGAAGIGAARRLSAAGADVLVLEARGRLGGRVWTRRDLAPVPLELGAEYIHTDYTSLAGLARSSGLPCEETAVGAPRRPFEFDAPELETLLAFAESAPPRIGEDLEAWIGRVQVPVRWRLLLSRALARDVPHRLDAALTLAELERYRCRGQQIGDRDTMLPEGFGGLLEHLAEGLEIRLGNCVSAVRWEDRLWRLTLRGSVDGARIGEVLADRVILAVPLGVLKAADIVIDPPLPETHRRAVAEIGQLDILKTVMVVDLPREELPQDIDGRLSSIPGVDVWQGASSHSDAPAVFSGFAAGAHARKLLMLDDRARRLWFVEALRRTTGISAAVTAYSHLWAADPFARGAYSSAPPGMSGQARRSLSEPVGGGLALVGEALHEELPRTVGGAYESGTAGADRLLALR